MWPSSTSTTPVIKRAMSDGRGTRLYRSARPTVPSDECTPSSATPYSARNCDVHVVRSGREGVQISNSHPATNGAGGGVELRPDRKTIWTPKTSPEGPNTGNPTIVWTPGTRSFGRNSTASCVRCVSAMTLDSADSAVPRNMFFSGRQRRRLFPSAITDGTASKVSTNSHRPVSTPFLRAMPGAGLLTVHCLCGRGRAVRPDRRRAHRVGQGSVPRYRHDGAEPCGSCRGLPVESVRPHARP